jgi:TolB-like protein/Tfp pilus assembly protein PilF/tRNA A-37 threonylcarbamoyl transferase component Bud32
MPDLLERLKSALAYRYAVESEIGRGGMAVVFLAEDLKHGRRVALKVLHPELAASLGTDRFLREIEIAAKLEHPHILALIDSGEADGLPYYVMPHVEGESLRERLEREGQLPIDQALSIAVEVADGLAYAHEHSVVHRDIKPGNILLSDGHARIADFGVARAISEAGGEKVTATGMAVGTPAYMSPEQASGEEVDARSDLYALGCVLYEMLAGEPPLTGPTPQAIVARRMAETPSPLPLLRDTVPSAIDAVVGKALAKSPADRYRSVREFADALAAVTGPDVAVTPSSAGRGASRAGRRRLIRWAVVAAAAVVLTLAVWREAGIPPGDAAVDLRSIAVLPFATRTSAEEDRYFAEGMHDDLLTQLSRIDSLTVISRTSVMQYRDTEKTIAEIAEELGVATVLEGGIQRAGDHVRVNVQLIEAETEKHLWAETYDQELTVANVFAIQGDLTTKIARALEAALTPDVEERLDERPTESLAAYDLYTRGRYLYNKGTAKDDLEGAAELFQKAIDEDPDYADAYVGLAVTYLWLWYFHHWGEEDALPLARAAVERALDLDDTLAEAHSANGWILTTDRLYEEAEREHLRALELRPGSAFAHNRYGITLLTVGRYEEAVRETRRAVELEPLSVVYRQQMVGNLAWADDWNAVFEEAGKLLELEPDNDGAYYWLAWAHFDRGEHEEAIAAGERAVESAPDSGDNPPMLAFIHASAGNRDEALRVLEDAEARGAHVPLKEIASVYGALGELDRAFEYLDRAYEEETADLFAIKDDGSFAPLHSDPRWDEFLRKLELE